MTNDEYLKKFLNEIETAKANGRKGVFKMNEKIPDSAIKHIQNHLISNTTYRVEFRKCQTCKRTWDIIVVF